MTALQIAVILAALAAAWSAVRVVCEFHHAPLTPGPASVDDHAHTFGAQLADDTAVAAEIQSWETTP